MQQQKKERIGAILRFYEKVLNKEKEPEELVFFFIKNGLGEPTADDWIQLGFLIARDETPASSDFKSIIAMKTFEKYEDLESLLDIIFENLEGYPYVWYHHVGPGMIAERSSNRKQDRMDLVNHLLLGKMVSVVSCPEWMSQSGQGESWEVVQEANVWNDQTKEQMFEYMKLFDTELSSTLEEVGYIDDSLEEGELPDDWDTALLRLSDDWASAWFDTDFYDLVEEKAADLIDELNFVNREDF